MSAAAVPLARQLPKIENVVFPTDFSKCAQAALPYACVLAKQNHASLHLLNVVGSTGPAGPLGVPYLDPVREEEIAKNQLDHVAQDERVQPLRHQSTIHRGATWEVLCRLAQEHSNSLIVMGTHGRKGVRQLFLGSVAEQVFRKSKCPVLTVGPGASPKGPINDRFSTILVAVDLSPRCAILIDWARLLASTNEARLAIFHAVDNVTDFDMAMPGALDDEVSCAQEALARLAPRDLTWSDTVLKIGSAPDGILQTASDRNADLIIIGARRGTTLAAHTPWACAHEVVCAAPCPVLTIPH